MAASPVVAADALAQISPARRLKPLVLAKTSGDSVSSPRRPSAAGGPLGGYRVLSESGEADVAAERPAPRRVSMADRPLIVQVSRPSPVDVLPSARRCSGSQRRRVSSGRVPPRARRALPLSPPPQQGAAPMHFVLHSPAGLLDAGLLSSPDAPTPPLPSKLRVPRLRAPHAVHGRRVRSETFAFPEPPAAGLMGLGLGDIGNGFASLHRRPMPRLRIPPSPAWAQDATEWVNGLSPLAAASSSDECGLTGAQGWSPDSSSLPSPALASSPRTAPLALQKRRTVSQPAPPPAANDDDDDEEEPEEYPFPLVPTQQRPSFGLLRLPADFSETRAPSLAEQMAFACGLGSDCEWETEAPVAVARPASQAYTSAAAYLTQSYGTSDDERPLSAEVGHSWTGRLQSDSEDDEAAFWRAPVASQSALSRSNTVTSTLTADSPILSGHLAADSGASSDESLASPRSAFSSSGASDASSATSHGVHSMHGYGTKQLQRQPAPAFSPVEIDRLFHTSLLTPLAAPCTPQLVTPEVAHEQGEAAQPGSPGMLAEFSYLLADGGVEEASPASTVACGVFSPALNDAELNLPTTPAPLEHLPSPTPTPGAFPFARSTPALALLSSASCPAPASSRTEDARLLQSASTAPSHMFKSASFAGAVPAAEAPASVLSRPRPGTRRSTFFGGAGPAVDRAQTPPKVIVLQLRRPSGSPTSAASPRPSIPGRRSSLECKPASVAEARAQVVAPSRNSPEAFWQETRAELAPCTAAALPAAALPTAASAPQLDALAGAPRPRRVPVPSVSALELLGGGAAKNAAGMSRSRSELLPSTAPAGVLSPRAMAEVREACRQKQAFLRAAAAAGVAGPSAQRPSSAMSGSLAAPSPRSVRFSQEVVRSAAPSVALLSPTSILKPSRPTSAQSAPPAPRSHGMVASASLPTLFVARSHSQRRRGVTGVPETEPTAQALAKLGLNVGCATRSSTVRAVSGAAAPAAPSGIILVVEEVVHEEERCLVRL
ncbi:hypothetical protein FA09DRAFT_329964 [Tilletiopsis washingtonensis]|jgi:hypothetical protein|uniref:Uncharacterized protein n=1 Tax=Tilletiopsis washingtonensis TaxID=58919 RepID=A0A316Z871_9BASI|nr:hypothetical protein FA09DRAFT_329964 [Tilletiopsis washingtonensis]PWN97799.1 hypothetical protein FA09DRAFT_329964 [Tilletiopsis washingtonensis]